MAKSTKSGSPLDPDSDRYEANLDTRRRFHDGSFDGSFEMLPGDQLGSGNDLRPLDRILGNKEQRDRSSQTVEIIIGKRRIVR